jgi:hypothetical protein
MVRSYKVFEMPQIGHVYLMPSYRRYPALSLRWRKETKKPGAAFLHRASDRRLITCYAIFVFAFVGR